MSRMIPSFAVCSFAMLISFTANANIVVSSPAGQWHAAVAPDQNSIDAFWDQRSNDGARCNVGYWLGDSNWSTGTGSRCNSDSFVAGTGGPGNLAFFGGVGDPSQNVGWYFNTDSTNELKLKLEVAGNRGNNQFGWYDASSPAFSTASKTLLYDGPSSPTSPNPVRTITIAAQSSIGFFLCSGPCKADYSNASYSGDGSTGSRAKKFALFSEAPAFPAANSPTYTYWVGVEDQPGSAGNEGIGDYNDFLIRATVVPEPGFYGALAIGLGGLYILSRRRQQC